MDSTFWSAIQRPDRENLAEAWWPRRGPSWDAIAVVTRDQQEPVVLLVEAKAHVAEFTVGQFAGTNTRSIEMITDALNRTREKLGAVRPVDAWLGEHYQLANRLAWTHWLRERDIDARYAYVLFAEDRSHKPTTAEDLRAAADAAYTALGVDPAQAHWVSDVVLDGIG
jgi:hypothetical protein